MKKIILAAAALAAFNASALTTGDLAFTAFNADEDGWSMVALTSLAANTKVYFSDNEWTGTAFNGGESFSSWNSGVSAINAGTVIRFTKTDSATLLGASVGTFARESVSGSTNWGLSQSADTIYAYVGASATATPTSFLAAISSGTFGIAADGVLTNTGLAIGAGAVQLQNGSDYAEYSGTRAGATNFAAYKATVSDVSKWTDLGDGSYAANTPNLTAFTISPVPEPESYAMLLAGLGLMATIARRRNKTK
jgi:hypothetical protein